MCIANNLYALGLIDYNKEDYEKALSLLKRSLEIWEELKDKSAFQIAFHITILTYSTPSYE
jgi:hypothetical protein